MKMKFVTTVLLTALLVSSAGCMTASMVKRAKGYTDERVQPLEGDTVFLHGGFGYVIQQKHAEGKNAEKMPPSMQYNSHPPYYAFKPCPAAYAFLPLTIPLDIATSPFQLIGLGLEAWFISGLGRTP